MHFNQNKLKMVVNNMSNIHVSLDVLSTLTLCSRVNYNNNFCMASPEVIVQGYSVKKLLLKLKAVLRGTICMNLIQFSNLFIQI